MGIIIYEFISSQIQNGVMDWRNIVELSIAGFIGILIGLGFRNVLKKDKS